MIEIRITKEIQDFEPKIIGPLTFRQMICVGVGAPICYFILKYLSPILTVDVAAFFCIFPALIAYLFGWLQPYGMKTEKFIQSIFITRILAPSIRKYKIENTHEILLNELAKECCITQEKNEQHEKKKRKNKGKKKRYKLSPKAYK